MNINLVLPYDRAFEMVHTWAQEEQNIDFRKNFFAAARCTISFAATELETYLQRIGYEVSVSSQCVSESFNLVLAADSEQSEQCGFYLSPFKIGLNIRGESRIGVLYGCYEFLRMQGVRWLNPDRDIVPQKSDFPILPEEERFYQPSMPLGRGFDFEGPLKESKSLWLWMARNRLNLSAYRPNTAQFQKKLGMSFKIGGHIFEEILNPDKVGRDGKTLWEQHRDWYGTDKKEDALRTQFCTSNEELLEYLSETIVDRLKHQWYWADRVDVWGFDCWGNTCMCERCRRLGNGSDKMLHFVAYLRRYINQKIETGELDHNVRLVMCAYEGTATLEPPEKPIPKELVNSGDYIVFYPILRCYEHAFFDNACSMNEFYNRKLKGWRQIPVMLGEYYNVSKFEDMPLLFTHKIAEEIPYYSKYAAGMTYMHLPMTEWGIRNITQLLYAQLCWDAQTDVRAWTEQYFSDRYGEAAKAVQKIYESIEKAVSGIVSWRSWKESSVLSRLMTWDGNPPKKPLEGDDHIGSCASAEGKKMLHVLRTATDGFCELHRLETERFVKFSHFKTGMGVNPVEKQFNARDPYLESLEEDIRLLQYGSQIMELMLLFVEYYNGLCETHSCDSVWQKIEEKAEQALFSYTPICFPGAFAVELEEKDVLERAQLKTLYYKCKSRRIHGSGR